MDKYQKFAMCQYSMNMADQYVAMIRFLEEIKYLLRIQNRQEEASLINDAIQRINRAASILADNPVQSTEKTV